jgi:LysR family transcriptional regulator for metE and metH
MDIDSRSLELLEAIASDGTLTAASRRMHVSQPALSQRLSGLEARLGLRLFDREGRRLVPTRAGRRLLHTSSAVLAELRAAARDLDDLRHGRGAVVRLASQCSTNYQWLPPVVHAYGERFPGTEVRIESVPHDEPVAALLADRIDIGLVAKFDRRMESLRVDHLFDDAMVAVVPDGHPWAARPYVDGPEFNGVSLIVFESYDPARVPALPLPIPPGGTPAKVITTPVVTELALEMVVAGQGVAVLPEWVVTPYLASRRLAAVPLTARPAVRAWSCVTRREPPAHVEAFCELIRAHFAGGPTG